MELLHFASQGGATQLVARRAWQLPGIPLTLGLEAMQLSGRDAQGAPWQLNAPQGELRGRDTLNLHGGVALRGRGSDGAELRLKTPQLRFELQNRQGGGDSQLELRWGHRELRGRGFVFSLSEQWLELLHDAETWRTTRTTATATALESNQCRAGALRLGWGGHEHRLRYDNQVHCVADGLVLHAEQLSLSVSKAAPIAVTRAVASGEPALFRHIPAEDHPEVNGSAQRLEYHHNQQHLSLQGEARLWHDGRWVEGERIDYHMQGSAQEAVP